MTFSQDNTHMELKKRIMRRVYGIWFWKTVAPLLAVEAVLLLGVAVGVLTQISVRAILLNALSASSDVMAFVRFFITNFLAKSIQSRLLLAIYFAFAGFFLRDVWNAIRRYRGADSILPAMLALGNRSRSSGVI